MSDYLWDGTGEPDAEVARLESLLGELRHRPRAFKPPPESGAAPVEALPVETLKHATHARRLFRPAWLAVAAAVVIALAAGALVFLRAGRLSEDPQRASQLAPASRPSTQTQPSTQLATGTQSLSPTPIPTQEPAYEPERREQQVASKPPLPARERRSDGARAALPASAQRKLQIRPATDFDRRDVTNASASLRDGSAPDIASQRLAAKEQLVYALRLTSDKLREVRVKTMQADNAKTSFDGRPNR